MLSIVNIVITFFQTDYLYGCGVQSIMSRDNLYIPESINCNTKKII